MSGFVVGRSEADGLLTGPNYDIPGAHRLTAGLTLAYPR